MLKYKYIVVQKRINNILYTKPKIEYWICCLFVKSFWNFFLYLIFLVKNSSKGNPLKIHPIVYNKYQSWICPLLYSLSWVSNLHFLYRDLSSKFSKILLIPNQVLWVGLISVVHHKLSVREASTIGHHTVVQILLGSSTLARICLIWWSFEGTSLSSQVYIAKTHSDEEHGTFPFTVWT